MFDFLHDPDSDSSDRDPDRGSGRGRERDDSPYGSSGDEEFMPMTRRDAIDRMQDQALRDTRKFLARREPKRDNRMSIGSDIVSLLSLAGGVAGSAYLSQRFRNAGGVVPLGVLLGGLGYTGAHFGVFGHLSPYAKNASIGAALASLAIWAAGYGSIAAEKSTSQAAVNPATGHLGLGPGQPPSPWPPQPLAFAPAQPPVNQPQAPQSQQDFMNLILGRRAA